jgi:leucyl aminopeptidase (aminopeptidase T)
MRKPINHHFLSYFSIVLLALIFSNAYGQDEDPKISTSTIAQRLARQCANVQENESVMIIGGTRDAQLLEDIATQVRKLGAHPLVVLNTDRMTKGYWNEVPAEYDSQEPELALKLASVIDVMINIDHTETLGLLADVPSDRLAATEKMNNNVINLMMSRDVRQIMLGNDLYPIRERAVNFGLPVKQLNKIFWDGINIDYQILEERGKKVKSILAAGSEMHITHPNGTDLKVNIAERPVYISDGVISEEDVKTGAAACMVWLPAGEVYLTPIRRTAVGKVIVNRHFYEGKEIQDLELKFTAGKLTEIKATAGLEKLQARYRAADEGKAFFSFIDIGINPKIDIPPGSQLGAWMAEGMVTVGFGNNIWAGGENNTNFYMANHLPGCTLKVDDITLIKKGKLQF